MRGGLRCRAAWLAPKREESKQQRKNYRRGAEDAEKSNRSNTEHTKKSRGHGERQSGRIEVPATKPAGQRCDARLRRRLKSNLVAAFGCWRWDAAGQKRGVQSHYGDDDVRDHHRFGIDQDAVSEPDHRAEGLHDAERLVIAEKIGRGDKRGGEPADGANHMDEPSGERASTASSFAGRKVSQSVRTLSHS